MSNLLLFDEVRAGWTIGTLLPASSFKRDDKVFRTEDGKIFPFLFGSEFPLLRWKLDGRDISALLAERYAVGQRGVCVFLTSEIEDARLGDGGPYSDQQILDALGPFADELRLNGFNLDACVFQAASITMPRYSRQQAFWNAVLAIAQSRPWMTVSVSKEWWKQQGAVNFDSLRRSSQSWDGGGIPDGGTSGLNVAPGIYVSPMRGSHDNFQASRNSEWPRKTKSAWDISQATGMGCVTGEPMGADETDQPGRRSNQPDDFFWSAAVARLMSLGVYFHSQAGIRGLMYGPVQRKCAQAHFSALSMIPPECQLGGYAKSVNGFGIDTNDELCLRTYQMNLSAHEGWAVVIRPSPAYRRNGSLIFPATINGFSIVGRFGPQGTVLHLVR